MWGKTKHTAILRVLMIPTPMLEQVHVTEDDDDEHKSTEGY